MSNTTENVILRRLRGDMSRARLAARFEVLCEHLRRETGNHSLYQTPSREAMEKQIARLEKGSTQHPGELYMSLYCRLFSASAHELFGELAPTTVESDRATFSMRNHKLIPMYVGPGATERAIGALAMTRSASQPTECHYVRIQHPRGLAATLWAWPFGVILFHVVEEVEQSSLADLAIWHRRIYDEQTAWASARACRLLDLWTVDVQYAMPINWLTRSIWDEHQIDTALKILTMPRVLLRRDPADQETDLSHARMIERSLLRDGFEGAHTEDFGVRGISRGVASWAGVAYHPFASERSLTEEEVISYELTLQALWSYCDWIRCEVEAARDPEIRAEHGWRLLRALRSIVTTPRPEESSQMFPLRNALLGTSGIMAHLNQAADTLYELKG